MTVMVVVRMMMVVTMTMMLRRANHSIFMERMSKCKNE